MIRLTRALHAHRRGAMLRRGRDQDGFALMMVLGAIALTALVTAALLGLLLTTIRATESYERNAREMRAADGAIEAAIAQLRRDPAGFDPCATASPVLPVDDLEFDQGTPGTGDDVSVQVDCSTAPAGEAGGSTEDQIRLVGADGYQGDIAWDTSAAAAPNLVHAGHDPLRFLSGLTVRGGAAVQGDAARGAVEAAGQYVQGAPGPGSSAAEPCGALGTPNQTSWINDLDGAPECDVDPLPLDDDPTDGQGLPVNAAEPPVPSCSGAVVKILPGRYDAARTRQVNALTGGGCTNKTFYFPSGVYHFDADSGSAGTSQHALVLADPGSYYVFGTPSGWSEGAGVAASAVAADPNAVLCNDADGVDGTSLVLSARTEIQHLGGRVAICPKLDPAGEPYPAIYQETTVPSTVDVTGALPWSFTFHCPAGIPPGTESCTSSGTYAVSTAASNSRPLTSVKVLVTGSESPYTRNNVVATRRTTIAVHRPDGSLLCSTGAMSGTPNSALTSSFELLTGGCAGVLSDESLLTGQLRISHSMQLGCVTFLWAIQCATQPMTITDVEVQANSIFGRVQPSGVSAPANQWQNLQNAAADDDDWARPNMPCADPACFVAPNGRTPSDPFVHRMTLDGFELALPAGLADAGIDPNLTGLRLLMGLVVEGDVPRQFFAPDVGITVELETADGKRCVTKDGFVNSTQEIAFDLLGPNEATAGCDAVLSSFGQLDGARVSFSFETPCVQPDGVPWECAQVFGQIVQIRPPSVQHVTLAAATDSYAGPPATSQVNIDAAAGATGSSFNVFGSAWLPSSDLDIHWKGLPTGRPLFGDDLVLNGLGSDMAAGASMGIVCCGSPSSRTVDLVASVDGADVLMVRVRFGDVDPETGDWTPGHTVSVLDWKACGRTECVSA